MRSRAASPTSSRRAAGPFVAIDCAAIPEPLLERELFGHEGREGVFQQAGGGTLLLDGLGELGLVLQPKLLRAVQELRIRPVGAEAEVPILPDKVRASPARRHAALAGTELPELLTLEELERRHVLRVLGACDGNRTDAAKVLGLDRKTLYRKLLRWGVGDDV